MSYVIDGAPGGTANIPGSPSIPSPDIFNQYLFQTAPLPNGDHLLEVVYNGSAPQSAPLVFDNLIILNRTLDTSSTTTIHATLATGTTPSTMTPGPASDPALPAGATPIAMLTTEASSTNVKSSSTPPVGARSHSADVGAKVGIVVGGCLALIGLTMFIFVVHRRWGRFYNQHLWYSRSARYHIHEDGRV